MEHTASPQGMKVQAMCDMPTCACPSPVAAQEPGSTLQAEITSPLPRPGAQPLAAALQLPANTCNRRAQRVYQRSIYNSALHTSAPARLCELLRCSSSPVPVPGARWHTG